LDEILTNAISYGYDRDGGTGEHLIHIRGTMADGLITLEVEDDGRPFNPLEVANREPDLTASIEDRPIGGLGLFMVNKLMDQLEYHRKGEKNLLVMKRLVPPQLVS
jgi:anti-sigma regulatory factor (Ser/Thr protein kinase)